MMLPTIRDSFRASGLSMKQLAERADVPYAAIHGLICDPDRDPKLSTVAKVCRVLGLELKRRRKGRS